MTFEDLAFIIPYAPLLIFLVLVPILFYREARADEALQGKLQEVAAQTGLRYEARKVFWRYQWLLSGRYHEADVQVKKIVKRSGKHSTTYTQFEFQFEKPISRNFYICKESFLSFMTKAIQGEDLKSGNPDFDKAFLIYGEPAPELDQLIHNPSFQTAIQQLFELNPLSKMDSQGVTVSVRGTIMDTEKYRQLLEAGARVVETVKY